MNSCLAKTRSDGICQLIGNPKMAAANCTAVPAQGLEPMKDALESRQPNSSTASARKPSLRPRGQKMPKAKRLIEN